MERAIFPELLSPHHRNGTASLHANADAAAVLRKKLFFSHTVHWNPFQKLSQKLFLHKKTLPSLSSAASYAQRSISISHVRGDCTTDLPYVQRPPGLSSRNCRLGTMSRVCLASSSSSSSIRTLKEREKGRRDPPSHERLLLLLSSTTYVLYLHIAVAPPVCPSRPRQPKRKFCQFQKRTWNAGRLETTSFWACKVRGGEKTQTAGGGVVRSRVK